MPTYVELDHDVIKRDSTVQHIVHRCVRVHALRRSREIIRLAGVAVHVRPEPRRERHEVLRRGLEVEVETVNDGRSERSVGRARVGAEQAPNVVGRRLGRRRVGEAAFGVRGSADGQSDRLSLGLARLDVFLDLGTVQELGTGEHRAVVAGICKIRDRRLNPVQEGQRDDLKDTW